MRDQTLRELRGISACYVLLKGINSEANIGRSRISIVLLWQSNAVSPHTHTEAALPVFFFNAPSEWPGE